MIRNIIGAVKDFFGITFAGRRMADAAKGKQAQIGGAAAATFLGLLIAFGQKHLGIDVMPFIIMAADMLGITKEQFLGGAGIALYGAFNWYLTAATTNKVGITGRRAPETEAPVVSVTVGGPGPDASAQVGGVAAEPESPRTVWRGPYPGVGEDSAMHGGG